MVRVFRVMLVIIAVFLMALPAAASSGKDPYTVSFSQIDENGDGSVVLTEFVAVFPKGGKELHRLADKDKDGKLTKQEWDAWLKKYGDQSPEAFAVRHVVLDQDQNGEVVLEEFVAVFGPGAKEAFNRADKDKDGKLSKKEWEAWQAK